MVAAHTQVPLEVAAHTQDPPEVADQKNAPPGVAAHTQAPPEVAAHVVESPSPLHSGISEAQVEVVATIAEAPPLHTLPVLSADLSATYVVACVDVEQAKKKRRGQGTSVPRWTPEEEDTLRQVVAGIGERSWPQVAERLGSNRSAAGVDQHWCSHHIARATLVVPHSSPACAQL